MSTNVITKSLADSSRDQASIFAAKVRIFGLIKRGALGGDVVKELLPAGQPLLFEKAMWDYKESLPTASANPTPDESKAHGAKMAEIVKDVVAFLRLPRGRCWRQPDTRSRQRPRHCLYRYRVRGRHAGHQKTSPMEEPVSPVCSRNGINFPMTMTSLVCFRL